MQKILKLWIALHGAKATEEELRRMGFPDERVKLTMQALNADNN